MKILFICKYNKLRSKIAEALFSYYNTDKKNEAKSAGIRVDILSPYIVEKAKKLLEQRDVKVEHGDSAIVNDYLIKWADKIIIVADDVSSEIFPKNKVERWEIEDVPDENPKKISIRFDEIDKKVKELIERIKSIT